MTNGKPSLKAIFQINLRFLTAALALFYGWLCWQWTSPEWWGLGLTAIMMFIGGGGMFAAAVFKVVALVMRGRQVRTFKKQGGKVRADRLAGESDLKKGGMVR